MKMETPFSSPRVLRSLSIDIPDRILTGSDSATDSFNAGGGANSGGQDVVDIDIPGDDGWDHIWG